MPMSSRPTETNSDHDNNMQQHRGQQDHHNPHSSELAHENHSDSNATDTSPFVHVQQPNQAQSSNSSSNSALDTSHLMSQVAILLKDTKDLKETNGKLQQQVRVLMQEKLNSEKRQQEEQDDMNSKIET